MPHVAGLLMLAGAAFLVWLAIQRRHRNRESPPPVPHESLRMLADAAPAIVILGLLIAALQVAVAFVMTNGGGGLFSIVDLGGFLALLAAYGYWLKVKTAR
jgi:threonine/homoserine/homoserine lactone efflux protein